MITASSGWEISDFISFPHPEDSPLRGFKLNASNPFHVAIICFNIFGSLETPSVTPPEDLIHLKKTIADKNEVIAQSVFSRQGIFRVQKLLVASFELGS